MRTIWIAILLTALAVPGYADVFVQQTNGSLVKKTGFKTTVLAADTVGKTVVVTGSETVTGTVTVPSGVAVRVDNGGKFIKGTGGKITFNGPFQAGLYQVFSGFAAGDITGLREARPDWWVTNTVPGTTDMTTATQSALSSGAAVVVVSNAANIITSNLIPASNTEIVGSGVVSKLQFKAAAYSVTGTIYHMFYLTNQKNITFRNIWLDGGTTRYSVIPWDGDGAESAVYMKPSSDYAVFNINFENCKFSNFYQNAIQSYGRSAEAYPHYISQGIRVSNCVFEDIGANGVGANEWHDSSVIGSHFYNVGKTAMDAGFPSGGSGYAIDISAGCNNVVVSDNVINGTGGGIKTETHDNSGTPVPSTNIIIANNVIRGFYSSTSLYSLFAGIRVNGMYVSANGNKIYSPYGRGIDVGANALYSNIESNSIFTPQSGAGIEVGGSSHVIKGNVVTAGGNYGLVIGASNIIATGNLLSGCVNDGIRVTSGNNIVLSGNITKDNTGQGISINPTSTAANVTMTGNIAYDTRAGGSRTQQRGIFVTGSSSNVIAVNNNCYNNVLGDFIGQATNAQNTSLANEAKITYGAAAPVSGTWTRGDIVYNAFPDPSEYVGWICTATGTPGTWKGFGSIAP